MMMEEECDCAHEQAGQRRLDSLRPTGASTCVVRVQALSLVAVRNNLNPSPSHHKQKTAARGWVISPDVVPIETVVQPLAPVVAAVASPTAAMSTSAGA